MLYFVLADLASVDVMYQFSLAWYINMFAQQIAGGPQEKGSAVPAGLHGTLRPGSGTSRTGGSANDKLRIEMPLTDDELIPHMQKMIDRWAGFTFVVWGWVVLSFLPLKNINICCH